MRRDLALRLSRRDWSSARARRRPPRRSTGRATGLVSVFGRERLGADPWLADPLERSRRVHLHDPAQPRELRARLAEQIRANRARRAGRVEALAGPERAERRPRRASPPPTSETMRRAGAAERYFFARSLLRRRARRSSAAGCWSRATAASSARRRSRPSATASCTTSSAAPPTPRARPRRSRTWSRRCSTSPTSSACAQPRRRHQRRATASRSSSAASPTPSSTFFTHEIVCDPGAYAAAAADGRDAGGFFPAYRA